jgi:hypothetical protein
MLLSETVAVYCEIHTEHTNTLCRQSEEFLMVKHMENIVTTVL